MRPWQSWPSGSMALFRSGNWPGRWGIPGVLSTVP